MAVEVSEGHHHKESVDIESYELVNVDMEGGIVRGCGSTFRKTSEDWIVEPPFHEQGGAEASHGDVAGV